MIKIFLGLVPKESPEGALRTFGLIPQITDFGGFKREKVFNSPEKNGV